MHFYVKVYRMTRQKWAKNADKTCFFWHNLCNIELFLHFHEISATFTGFRGNNDLILCKFAGFCHLCYIYLKKKLGRGGVNDCVIHSKYINNRVYLLALSIYILFIHSFLFINQKNCKNTTRTQIQSYIIYIIFFFSMNIKKHLCGGQGEWGSGHPTFQYSNVFWYPCNTSNCSPCNTPSCSPWNTPSCSPYNTQSCSPCNTPSCRPCNTPSCSPCNTPSCRPVLCHLEWCCELIILYKIYIF